MPHDDNATNREAISAIFDLNNILLIIYVLTITEVPNIAENNLAATTVGPNTATNGRSKYW
jgi:competence protein ComGC